MKSPFVFKTAGPSKTAAAAAIVFLAAAISYLPLAHLFGFYRDDWYLLYGINSQGIGKLWEIFSIDRPFRAAFVGWIYQLLGNHAPLYTYSAYVMRCLGGLGFFWIVRLIWPRQKAAAAIAALLLTVYPGFLDMPNAFDFQTHIWAFTSAIFSIAFTLQAIRIRSVPGKVIFLLGAVVSQLYTLVMMEYYIGLEGLRFVAIFYLLWKQGNLKPLKFLGRFALWGLPSLMVDGGFMYWILFVFHPTRQATNVWRMIQETIKSLLLTLSREPINLMRDLMNVVFFSWAVPAYDLAFNLRLKSTLLIAGYAVVAGILVWLAGKAGLWDAEMKSPSTADNDLRDMLWIGIGTAVLTLLPVHFGDRQVLFDQYSRFSLVPSTGAVLIIAAVLLWLFGNRLRNWILVGLVAVAVITHLGNGYHFADFTSTIDDFWWQVSWRVPQIQPGSMLAASYADQGISESYFVWGPANLIYYPSQPPSSETVLTLGAITLEKSDIAAALSGSTVAKRSRGYQSIPDFHNLLVLSMPAQTSCVHVLDKNAGERSDQDPGSIGLLADLSDWDRILVNEPIRKPPQDIFGPEPAHTWCYYYEKASLAAQTGDWEQVLQLGDEASGKRLHAYDWIEWLPFAEGYAYLNRDDDFRRVVDIIRANPYYHYEACQLIQKVDGSTRQKYPDGYARLVNNFCAPTPE